MAKITSIDPVERTVQRDAEEALDELRACTLDSLDCVERLARSYPGAFAIAYIAFGVPSVLVFSVSADDGVQTVHRLPDALDRAKLLGNCVAYLPADVLLAFELQLAATKASRREKEQQEGASTLHSEAP